MDKCFKHNVELKKQIPEDCIQFPVFCKAQKQANLFILSICLYNKTIFKMNGMTNTRFRCLLPVGERQGARIGEKPMC